MKRTKGLCVKLELIACGVRRHSLAAAKTAALVPGGASVLWCSGERELAQAGTSPNARSRFGSVLPAIAVALILYLYYFLGTHLYLFWHLTGAREIGVAGAFVTRIGLELSQDFSPIGTRGQSYMLYIAADDARRRWLYGRVFASRF
jgi:hypothetical protein